MLANYASQLYVALIGIVMVPVYLHFMGPEAYGLVGFYITLQAWLLLLDMGLTPVLTRELARYRAGVYSHRDAGHLLISLERLFALFALFITLGGWEARDWVAAEWLTVGVHWQEEVSWCVALMAFTGALRLLAGLYQGGLVGLERQVQLNVYAAVLTTIRSTGVAIVLVYVSPSPMAFFAFTAVIAIVECWLFRRLLLSALGPGVIGQSWRDWSALLNIRQMASGIAFLTVVWISVSQVDRLALSHFLTLKDFGYVSVAMAMAMSVPLMVAPLAQMLQPRLTILAAQGNKEEFMGLYRTATQFVSALMAGVAGTVAVFSTQLVFAWTGNAEAAERAGPVLTLYALGNGIVALLTLTYFLQYAMGQLRLHIIGNVLFMLVWAPAAFFGAQFYGAVGSGTVWLVGNLLFLVLWTPVVHASIIPEISWRWLTQDILLVILPTTVVFIGLHYFLSHWVPGRLGIAGFLLFSVSVVIGIGLLTGSRSRPAVKSFLKGEFA